MARTALRKKLTTLELESLQGEQYAWKSKKGELFYLEPTTMEVIEYRGDKPTTVIKDIDSRGHKLFKVIFFTLFRELNGGICFTSGTAWSIPQLQDSGAGYIGRIA